MPGVNSSRFFFNKQIQPDTFEYTLHQLIDNGLDLAIFNDRFKNDETGAPAYDPGILLKIILFAYSRGIVSSRKTAQTCEESVVLKLLAASYEVPTSSMRVTFDCKEVSSSDSVAYAL
jgi:transposase